MSDIDGPRLAAFIEQRIEVLAQYLPAHLDFTMDAGDMDRFAATWLGFIVAHLRHVAFRMTEWTEALAERLQPYGPGVETTPRVVRLWRNALLNYLEDNAQDLPCTSAVRLLLDAVDCQQRLVIEHHAQIAREQEDVIQRCCRALLEATAHPLVVLNEAGFIDRANSAFAAAFDCGPDALAGRDFYALCDSKTLRALRGVLRVNQASRPLKPFWGTLASARGTFSGQFSAHLLCDARGKRAGAVISIMAENEGPENTTILAYFQSLIAPALPLPIQVFDLSGRLAYTSEIRPPAFPAGYTGAEPCCCFLHKVRNGGKSACPCKQVFQSGLFHTEEISHATADGMRWFLLVFLPLPDSQGRARHVACALYDMTRRKQLQKQLEHQIVFQQRSSLTSQIAVTVAHRLRNPLSVVIGFAEMLSKGLPPDQTSEAVTRILRNGLRCREIVENLLDFGQGRPLDRRPTDMGTLIAEHARPMLTPSQERRISWRIPAEPFVVECVPEQMAQVVFSLLDNALRAAASTVVCALEAKGDTLRLRVADDGPGVPLQLRERIFEPFFSTRRSEGCVGLGLSLARSVVADYGGSLALAAPVAGEPTGACFMLQMPLQKPLAAIELSPGAAASSATTRTFRKVLVVDDETDLLDLIKMALQMRGYGVEAVVTGEEATAQLDACAYDAVALDFQLPGVLSGRDVYEHILAHHPALAARTFFITADTLNYETRSFLNRAGRPVLEKPFLASDFLAELDKLFLT